MSQNLNNEFRRDPLAFARKYALLPGDPSGLPSDQLPGVGGTLYSYKGASGVVNGHVLYKTTTANRILGGNLELVDEHDPNCRQVEVKRKKVTASTPCGPPWFPMYYLSWCKDEILRTTLRPHKDQSQRGTKAPVPGFETATNTAADPPYDPADPDVFFTANVNGCMVVVEGSRQEPTVYHCNAMTTGHAGSTSPMDAALGDKDANKAQQIIGAKVGAMSTQVRAQAGAHPKALRNTGNPAQSVKGITQDEYMILAGNAIVGAGYEQGAEKIRGQIAAQFNIKGKVPEQIRIQQSCGTVFGVKKHGLWTFYYQKLIKYELWHDIAPWYAKAKWALLAGDLWFVAKCKEFWPGGKGVVL